MESTSRSRSNGLQITEESVTSSDERNM